MNKLVLITVMFSFSISVFSQDRKNAKLPVIQNQILASLTNATGWLLKDDGQWISRKNRIPFKIENQFKSLIDYEFYALGDNQQNFISYEIRNIEIKDTLNYILIKKFKDGYYK